MNKTIAIYGPTTTNKLGLALNLAKFVWGRYNINSEVINADSRKIYKGLVISQSLPKKNLLQKVKVHLFGTVSPRSIFDLYDFKDLVRNKISEVQKENNLPIIVGGSTLHMLAVIQDWQKGKKKKREIPENTLVLGMKKSKPALRKAVRKNVNKMFEQCLYKEFKYLYKESQKGKVSAELLNETLGYRQFLEMAEVSNKLPLELDQKDLEKVKQWTIKNIMEYAYKQELGFKKFSKIKIVRSFEEARKLTENFFSKN